MSVLRRIEKSLDHRVRSIFSGGDSQPGAKEAVEIYRDALEQISSRATPGNRGDRLFPYNRIIVELRADDPDRKAVLETLFDPGKLGEDIRSTLKSERVSVPSNLTVAVSFPDDAEQELRVICEKNDPHGTPSAPARMQPAYLVVVTGVGSPERLVFESSRINLGRVEDLQDSAGRTIRHNEMFFPEDAHEANPSVSRAHAHIALDPETGGWRIFDDGSSLGTTLFRAGKRIDVPAHAGRGVALRKSDEIYLGPVRLRFELI